MTQNAAKTNENIAEETLNFGTDVARLLEIVAGALYTNRDVFVRELVSNAADACDRLRYEALQNPDLTKASPDFTIRITPNPAARTLSVEDTGIGMSKQDMVENLGTIARSGTAAALAQLKDKQDGANLIGQFGVGFYSAFTASDKVEVISRRAGTDETFHWQSDGRSGFSVREATAEEAKSLTAARGTRITMHLKDDAADFLLDQKLKEVVLTYSDHIGVPVYIGPKTEEEDTPVNAASALWARPKSDITDEQYLEFYRHIGQIFDEPLLTAHWKAEGRIEYTALLYVPSLRPWDLYDPARHHAVRLYVRRVYITDRVENLIYPWLRFLRGVIDCEDLPLNISREALQTSPVLDKIRRSVTKRILGDLHKLSENDPPAFTTFWRQFGAVLKEGLYDAVEHREDIFKICRFPTTAAGEDLTTLDACLTRMKDGQEDIYYISGENADALKNAPQIEGFKSRGLEVLCMTDTVDEFWLQQATDYKGKKFRSVTRGNIDLTKFDTDKKGNENKTEEKDSEAQTKNTDALLNFLKAELQEDVATVRTSNRLTSSPVCLVVEDGAVDMHMERVLKIQQKYDPATRHILEINADHPLIQKLAAQAQDGKTDTPQMKDAARLLLDQARIVQGQPVSDPAEFARRMAGFMEKGI